MTLVWVEFVILIGVGCGVLLPQKQNVLLPSPNTHPSRTPSDHILICGLTETNVAEFNSTWYTPSGRRIELTEGTKKYEGRYVIRNLNVTVGILKYVSSLRISNLDYKDDGMFVCSVSYTLFGLESMILTGNASINFTLLVEVSSIISDTTGTIGSNVTLHCQMSRYLRPDSEFLWRRGRDILTNDSTYTITYNHDLMNSNGQLGVRTSSRGSSLTISNLQLSNTGNYSCFVKDTTSSAEVSLIVHPAPSSKPSSISNAPDSRSIKAAMVLSFLLPGLSGAAVLLGAVIKPCRNLKVSHK